MAIRFPELANITSISDGTYTTTYSYDSANQLYRENNEAAGKTWVWEYDNAGNITARKEYPYIANTRAATATYAYEYENTDWGDLLTKYNGNARTYDKVGNVLTDGTWTYTWKHGRQLTSMVSADTSVSYTYDADGLRLSKTVDGVVHNYIYSGSKLIRETYGTTQLDFSYDDNGNPYTLTYTVGSSTPLIYHYVVNLQGDVIRLVNCSGETRVTYEYDAWGNITDIGGTSTTLANANPLRYRGYVYDEETSLYYVSSRYYDPEIGRWINADSAIAGTGGDLLGYNQFAYCFNNPVNMDDATGNWPKWLETVAKAAAVVAVVVTAAVVVTVATAGTGGLALAAAGVAFGTACGGLVGGIANEMKGESFINGWAGGAVNGFIQSSSTAAMATVGLGPLGTIVGGGVGSGLGTAITESLNNTGKPKEQQKSAQTILNNSLKSIKIGATMSAMTAAIGYGVDFAQNPSGYNSWANSLAPGVGITPITPRFGEMMKGFFSCVDDALVYIFCD